MIGVLYEIRSDKIRSCFYIHETEVPEKKRNRRRDESLTSSHARLV